jgi:Zn-dependent membrane protease YugP
MNLAFPARVWLVMLLMDTAAFVFLLAGLNVDMPVLVAVGVALFAATSAVALLSRLGALSRRP